MTHAIDFDEVETKLFLLDHLCKGAPSICRRDQLSGDHDLDWLRYSGRLSTLVSNYLIDCAIKTRIVQDFIHRHRHAVGDVDVRELDRRARNGVKLGKFTVGSGELTLRESCNKIVHATEVELKWRRWRSDSSPRTWSGTCLLAGTRGRKRWEVELKVDHWCLAMTAFHAMLEEEVDWHELWH